jgi:RNA polymerase sigma-70 factor (ECF subfamily)
MSNFSHELALQIPRLRRYARALTHNSAWADDLVQDTMERALSRRWLFRANSNLCGWLFTMLYRVYLNDVSSHRIRHAVAEENAPEQSTSGDMTLQLDMQQALMRLSAEHRAVILLVGLEQMSYKEAAQALGIPIGTVMSRLLRAREQLRLLLSGEPAVQTTAAIQPQLTRIK